MLLPKPTRSLIEKKKKGKSELKGAKGKDVAF